MSTKNRRLVRDSPHWQEAGRALVEHEARQSRPRVGRDALGDPGPTPREIRRRKQRESDSLWGVARATAAATALGLMALLIMRGNGEKKDTTPYPGMPRVSYTIPHGGGSLDAVRAVDPKIADNAWKSSEAQQRLDKLEHFIEGQAPGGQSGSLQEGQAVRVPVIPGAQYPNHPQGQ